ncbi:TatD family hydrolase [Chryseolinea sp. T2]|uniref:TatD family hydrolase n=1 Tax=Chryseolinea sp. T2 TaxID=3129255 RepID=UPI0030781739
MNYFVDTHAHIYHEDFKADRADMLQRCRDAKVDKIYMPNVDHESIDDMMELESRSEGMCHSMMGLHPCSVKRGFEKELYIVENWLAKRQFAAVGEIGTDLYWDKTLFDLQTEAFNIQVTWAKKYRLPIVIHCRESIDETLALIEKAKDDNLTGIFHCFSGNAEQAKRIISLGFLLGIGGVATFKNGGLDKVLPEISLDHLVLETDSPYLAPVPYRGKRNEPSYIPIVASRISEIKRVTTDEVRITTSKNATSLFNHV